MRKLANRMQFGVPEESSLGNFTRFLLFSPDLHFQYNVLPFDLQFDAIQIHMY